MWAEHPEVPAEPIRAWQMWNEPNLPRLLVGSSRSRKGYVRSSLKAARAALRTADRRALAILAGLPSGRGSRCAGSTRRAAAATSTRSRSIRTPRGPTACRVTCSRRGGVMRRFGDRRKPVWVTELSWPAAKGRAKDPIGIATDDRGQARRLRAG